MSNLLAEHRRLSNRFFIMRHGNSLANQQKVVVSDPLNGVPGYGLSPLGIGQVNDSLARNQTLDEKTRIFSSDFKRARETADLVHGDLHCLYPVQVKRTLRERFFGNYELGADSIYPQVWARDKIDPDQTGHQVESANAVMARVTQLVVELDNQQNGATFLLIAHGDILQILQTAFENKSADQHRSLLHLDTAEIREVVLSVDSFNLS